MMKTRPLLLVVLGSILIVSCQGCGNEDAVLDSSNPRPNFNFAEPAWGGSSFIIASHTPEEGGPSGLWAFKSDETDKQFLIDGSITPSWSPDGQWLAIGRNAQIYKIRADGTELTPLTSGSVRKFFPAWSPDGQWITFSIQDGPFEQWGIWAVSSDGDSLRHIVFRRDTNVALNPDWSSQNKIAFVGYADGSQVSKVMIMDDMGFSLRVVFDPVRFGFFGGVDNPVFSPDGNRIAFQTNTSATQDAQIWVVDSDGRHPRQLTTAGGMQPSWSPDGRHIVYVRLSFKRLAMEGNGKLWIMNADGSGKRQLTF